VLFPVNLVGCKYWDVGHSVASMPAYPVGPAASDYLLKHPSSHFSVNTFHDIKFAEKRVTLMGEMERLSAALSSPSNLYL